LIDFDGSPAWSTSRFGLPCSSPGLGSRRPTPCLAIWDVDEILGRPTPGDHWDGAESDRLAPVIGARQSGRGAPFESTSAAAALLRSIVSRDEDAGIESAMTVTTGWRVGVHRESRERPSSFPAARCAHVVHQRRNDVRHSAAARRTNGSGYGLNSAFGGSRVRRRHVWCCGTRSSGSLVEPRTRRTFMSGPSPPSDLRPSTQNPTRVGFSNWKRCCRSTVLLCRHCQRSIGLVRPHLMHSRLVGDLGRSREHPIDDRAVKRCLVGSYVPRLVEAAP
jgi:hypothetical protein